MKTIRIFVKGKENATYYVGAAYCERYEVDRAMSRFVPFFAPSACHITCIDDTGSNYVTSSYIGEIHNETETSADIYISANLYREGGVLE